MNKPENNKDYIEQMHFDAFRTLLSDFPGGSVQRGVPPAPDFLVTAAGEVVGIEITSISTERREQEELRLATINTGQSEYERRGGPPVLASFFWNEAPIGKQIKTRTLGTKLADLVEQNLPLNNGVTELGWLELKTVGLAELLDSVRIARFSDISTHWTAPDAGYICSEHDVAQSLVTQKERKLASYRTACSKAWLLIVAEGISISRTVDCEGLAQMELSSSFDRAFLLDFFRRKLYPLKLTPQKS